MTETNSLLGVDQKDMVTLEKYLQDYFSNILKKLKGLKAQSKQSDIYFWVLTLLCLDKNEHYLKTAFASILWAPLFQCSSMANVLLLVIKENYNVNVAWAVQR